MRFIPSPFACHEYFQCIDEIAYLVTCPRGLYFSYAIQSCDYPSKNLLILLTYVIYLIYLIQFMLIAFSPHHLGRLRLHQHLL